MDRLEAGALAVTIAAHGGLFYALSAAREDPIPRADPIQVSFVREAGPTSAAPAPAPPAPSIAPDIGPPEEAAPEPAPAPPPPRPAPPPPAARPRAAAAPAKAPPKAVPAKAPPAARPNPAATARATRGSRFGQDFLKGLGSEPSPSRSEAPPAAEIGPAVRSSLGAEVRRQLKPYWKAPTGADAELLRTELSVALARDGSVVRVEIIGTSGQTASNKPQVKLHQEQAVRAVRLAAPFRLPPEYYDAWKMIRPAFDRRLSQ
jgi:hypothetical protein